MTDDITTLAGLAQFEQEIKKSRFRAVAGPVADVADAKAFIAQNSDPDAGHNCWAFRLGDVCRSHDDGEPGGTAGRPILQAINGQGLDGVTVIVSRWFGGILLGVGGLVRAYGGTATACLKSAERRTLIALQRLTVTCSFAEDSRIRASLETVPGGQVEQAAFTATGVDLILVLPATAVDRFTRMVADISRGQAQVAIMAETQATLSR